MELAQAAGKQEPAQAAGKPEHSNQPASRNRRKKEDRG